MSFRINAALSADVKHLIARDIELRWRPILTAANIVLRRCWWYPEGFAWCIDSPRRHLGRQESPDVRVFQRWLVALHDIGYVTRQEAVSMIPPLLLLTTLPNGSAGGVWAPSAPSHASLAAPAADCTPPSASTVTAAAAVASPAVTWPPPLPEALRCADVCAAPGSKTSQIAEVMWATGGCVIANDNSHGRSDMLCTNLQRLGAVAAASVVTTHDASKPWPGADTAAAGVARGGGRGGNAGRGGRGGRGGRAADGAAPAAAAVVGTIEEPAVAAAADAVAVDDSAAAPAAGPVKRPRDDAGDVPAVPAPHSGLAGTFSHVLVDAVCTGDGTLRKAPDLWRSWAPRAAAGIHKMQTAILRRALLDLGGAGRAPRKAAASTVTAGGATVTVDSVRGVVVYSTCSMNPIEDEAVVADALLHVPDVELVDANGHHAATCACAPPTHLNETARSANPGAYCAATGAFDASVCAGCGDADGAVVAGPALPGFIRRRGVSSWSVVGHNGGMFSSFAEAAGGAAGFNVTRSMFPPGTALAAPTPAEGESAEDAAARTAAMERRVAHCAAIRAQLRRTMRILPHDNDSGGFYVAIFALRKSAASPPPAPVALSGDAAAQYAPFAALAVAPAVPQCVVTAPVDGPASRGLFFGATPLASATSAEAGVVVSALRAVAAAAAASGASGPLGSAVSRIVAPMGPALRESQADGPIIADGVAPPTSAVWTHMPGARRLGVTAAPATAALWDALAAGSGTHGCPCHGPSPGSRGGVMPAVRCGAPVVVLSDSKERRATGGNFHFAAGSAAAVAAAALGVAPAAAEDVAAGPPVAIAIDVPAPALAAALAKGGDIIVSVPLPAALRGHPNHRVPCIMQTVVEVDGASVRVPAVFSGSARASPDGLVAHVEILGTDVHNAAAILEIATATISGAGGNTADMSVDGVFGTVAKQTFAKLDAEKAARAAAAAAAGEAAADGEDGGDDDGDSGSDSDAPADASEE